MLTKIEMDWITVSKEKCVADVKVKRWIDSQVIERSDLSDEFVLTIEKNMVQLSPAAGKTSFVNIGNLLRERVFAMARTYFSAINGETTLFEWADDKDKNPELEIDLTEYEYGEV